MCRTSARQFRMQWSSARSPRPVDFSRAIHRQRRRVLDLDPVRASAATIGAISPLRDQALHSHRLACGNPRLTLLLKFPEGRMSRMTVLGLAVLGSLYLSGQAFAQLTPPAGSAGAGNSPISGVPFGPANPRVLSDPSGIGNASSLPPLRSNPPVPVVSSIPTAPTRVVTPPSYPSASQQIISPYAIEPRSKAPPHRRGRPQVSSFTGICRGC